jgi:hypothetical protein
LRATQIEELSVKSIDETETETEDTTAGGVEEVIESGTLFEEDE